MLIKDLKPKEGNVELDVKVVEVRDIKETVSHGKAIRVAKAVIEDGSGKCMLTLWNDEIDNIHVGDYLRIRNGWCDEWKGEIQVTAGKYGSLEKIHEQGTVEIRAEEVPKDHEKQTKFFADAQTEYSDDDILTYDADDDII